MPIRHRVTGWPLLNSPVQAPNQIRTADVENATAAGSWYCCRATAAQIAMTAAAMQETRNVRMFVFPFRAWTKELSTALGENQAVVHGIYIGLNSIQAAARGTKRGIIAHPARKRAIG